MIGESIAHYKITEKLGEGGMGEVYRARDTKLNRDVALKILPQVLALDSQRMARFEREARVLASLNHAHIAQIYGIESVSASRSFEVADRNQDSSPKPQVIRETSRPRDGEALCLVLELVEGETLAEQIARGPIPVDEALKIALQICEGLEAAHEKGIIHRDLKPANIKITPGGEVKILDFGLAKAMEVETPISDLSHSPTLTHAATEAEVILGTASYMSPEQARGKPVDKRTDIWAFGCVLFEMLTKKKAFGGAVAGETVSDVLASVLKGEPDWEALPGLDSGQLRFLLEHCLEKDRSRRYRDIGDVAIQMQAPLEFLGVQQSGAQPHDLSRRIGLATSLILVLSAAIIGAAAVWLFGPSRTEELKEVIRFILPLRLPEGEKLGTGWGNPPFCLSPSGTHVAYQTESGSDSTTQIYIRSLESLDAEIVPDSQNGREPFFSPDGFWLGFAIQTSAGFSLKKVPMGRGQPLTLVDSITNARGLSWGYDNSIVYAPGLVSGLFMVSGDGGEPQSLTSPKPGEPGHRWPQLLPGGNGVLYTIAAEAGWAEAKIAVQKLRSLEPSLLVEGGTYGRYLPTGHLVYFRQGTLMAVLFDLQTMQMNGSPVPVAEGISQHSSSSAPRASISDSGSLAYLTQAAADDLALDSRSVVLVSREGEIQTLSEQPRPYLFPALSPDGQRIAMNISSSTQAVWILDTHSKSLRPLNDGMGSLMPIWTPDASRIAYFSKQPAARGLYWQTSDFHEQPEQLTQGNYDHRPSSFSPDGKLLAYTELHPETDGDIWILPLADGEPAWPYLQSEFFEGGAMFSPDGEWLAYASDKSGKFEVYVSPFPGPGQPQQVSIGGGQQPRWSRNGDELFFLDNEQKGLKVVAFKDGEGIGAGSPTPVIEFERPVKVSPPICSIYDVSSDGEHFVVVQELEPKSQLVPIQIVLNWFEELKRLVPTE